VVDLRDLFDDLEEPVFIDTSHVNEEGAAAIAAALYEQLAPVLAAA
jgi:lysophospholipase L1-like esterase